MTTTSQIKTDLTYAHKLQPISNYAQRFEKCHEKCWMDPEEKRAYRN